MRVVFRAIKKYYRKIWERLVLQCQKTDSRKAALAITIGICIGIIPFLGVTFILVSLVGFSLRLNQLVIQTAHLLVSPLQILFLFPFMKLGQVFFGNSTHPLSDQVIHAFRTNFYHGLSEFSGVVFSGVAAWFFLSLVLGLIMYRSLLYYFNRKGLFGMMKVREIEDSKV